MRIVTNPKPATEQQQSVASGLQLEVYSRGHRDLLLWELFVFGASLYVPTPHPFQVARLNYTATDSLLICSRHEYLVS